MMKNYDSFSLQGAIFHTATTMHWMRYLNDSQANYFIRKHTKHTRAHLIIPVN